MIRPGLALLLSLNLTGAGAQTLLERARQDQVVIVDAGDPAMNQAFARARAGLDGFLRDALARTPRNSHHAVKLRITGNGHTEYFWVVDLHRSEDGLRGRLDNEPRLVKHLRAGQQVRFGRGDIVDWLHIEPNGTMQGNYSTCVLLRKEKPEEARALAAQLRLRCD